MVEVQVGDIVQYYPAAKEAAKCLVACVKGVYNNGVLSLYVFDWQHTQNGVRHMDDEELVKDKSLKEKGGWRCSPGTRGDFQKLQGQVDSLLDENDSLKGAVNSLKTDIVTLKRELTILKKANG